jgi:hypothetical protein
MKEKQIEKLLGKAEKVKHLSVKDYTHGHISQSGYHEAYSLACQVIALLREDKPSSESLLRTAIGELINEVKKRANTGQWFNDNSVYQLVRKYEQVLNCQEPEKSEGEEMKRKKYWVGYSDGKPYIENCYDEYGEGRRLCVFKTRKEAKKRFQDVRGVYFVEDKPCEMCGGSRKMPESKVIDGKSTSQNCLHRPECAINAVNHECDCTCDGPKPMPCPDFNPESQEPEKPEHFAYAKDYPNCPHNKEDCFYARPMNNGTIKCGRYFQPRKDVGDCYKPEQCG